MPEASERGIRSAQLGILINALLAIAKLVAGIVGAAYALVADAVESTGAVHGRRGCGAEQARGRTGERDRGTTLGSEAGPDRGYRPTHRQESGSRNVRMIALESVAQQLHYAARSLRRRRVLAIVALTTLAMVSGSVAQQRFQMLLVSAFSLLMFVLAVLGTYGVTAYSVTERTDELGIRSALGATAGDIRRMVLREGGQLAVIGIIIGGVATAALSRVLTRFVSHVSPLDLATFVVAPAVLAAAALVATFIPAHRAARGPDACASVGIERRTRVSRR